MAERSLTLSKKLLVMVLAAGTCMTSLATAVQLFAEYLVAKTEQSAILDAFAASSVPSLRNLVWRFDENGLQEQLKAALQSRDIVSVRVISESGDVLGEVHKPGDYTFKEIKSFWLTNPADSKESIGRVLLEFTNDFIVSELKRKTIIVLTTNFFKTLVLSLILLYLFRIHVVDRLSRFSQHLRQRDWKNSSDYHAASKKWPFGNQIDEIDIIESEMNHAASIIKSQNTKRRDFGDVFCAFSGVGTSVRWHRARNQ